MDDEVEVMEIWSKYPYRCAVCGDSVHKLRLVNGVVVRDESPHVHTSADWSEAYGWALDEEATPGA